VLELVVALDFFAAAEGPKDDDDPPSSSATPQIEHEREPIAWIVWKILQ
jgi:hypothetical protein